MPKEFALYDSLGGLDTRFRCLAHGFLGPIFIVSVAYRVDFGVVRATPMFLLALLGAAIVGKVLGAGGGAYLSGEYSWKESLTAGIGMNGRGTVELIMASIGVEIGLLNETHLSLLVLVAFTTTLMVPIVLNYILPRIPDLERI